MPTVRRNFKQQAARDIKTKPPRLMEKVKQQAYNSRDIPLYIQMCVSLFYYKQYMASQDKKQFLQELRT